MFVRKNGIMYNLNSYAKVYPSKDRCALCLADVQGDFDTIDFNTNKSLEEAFRLIINFFKMPDNKKNKEDNIIDLDEIEHNYFDNKSMEIEQEKESLKVTRNPLEDLYIPENELYRVNQISVEPPVGVSREEWLSEIRERLYNQPLQACNVEADISSVQIDENRVRLSNLEAELNNRVEELNTRNQILENEVRDLRSIIYNLNRIVVENNIPDIEINETI